MNAISALKQKAKEQEKEYALSLNANHAPERELNVPEYLGRCIAAIRFGEYVTSIPSKIIADLDLHDCDKAIAIFQEHELWPRIPEGNTNVSHIPTPNAINAAWRRAIKSGKIYEHDEEFSLSFQSKNDKGIYFTLSFNRDVALLLYKICAILTRRTKELNKVQDENFTLFGEVLQKVKDGKATASECKELLEKYKASGQSMPVEAYELLQERIEKGDIVQELSPEVQEQEQETTTISPEVQERLDNGPKDEDEKFSEYCSTVAHNRVLQEQERQKRLAAEQEQERQKRLAAERAAEKANLNALTAQRDKLQDSLASMIAERNIVLAKVANLQELSRKRERKLADYADLLAQIENNLRELSTFILSCK